MGEVVIDNVIEERGTGTIILWFSQPEPWDTPGLMLKVQEKLNGYISTIRDGLFVQRFPQYDGCQFKITIACYEAPPEDVRLRLDRVNQALSELGIGFGIMVIAVRPEPKHNLTKSIRSFFGRLFGRPNNCK
jgi:hypothetical protein